MASANSDWADDSADDDAGRYVASTVAQSVKILVVGAFGVGKTTLIGAVSEIAPLRTEETMTSASVGIDSLMGLDDKATTTVAMDFGRITVSSEVVLYLFGTPGQRRFWDLWEGLSDGAVGALVLIDSRRLEDSFEVFDQLETRTGMPFAVAVNGFPDAPRYDTERLREALDLLPDTPIVQCDARDKESSAQALIKLVEHALHHPTPQKALT
ncbi:GTP-binding protein [Actinophytocola oryzae]|uniref:Signal recognition particle receptor subunit beta n=1 Tax=Actinophytocola oryzae TaxID=502181 RepID=A0A4R7VQP6_9PSEU|nr:ATP/GTP-binding protein [Actinophytocola oryzae]TDV52076.1 signal recognition particle receptor subunit beta [Actinophytocola oryzae]